MSIEEKLEQAAVKVLKESAIKRGVSYLYSKDLIRLAERQQDFTLDIMIGLGQNSHGYRVYSVRIHEGESLIEREGVGPTLEAALDDLLED